MSVRVLQQDSHRNGVGGAGFVVSLVEWTEPETPTPHFIAVSFYSTDPRDVTPDQKMETFRNQTAVLSVDLTFAGNISMRTGAAWRGADSVGPTVTKAWRAACLAGPYGGYDPFAADDTPEGEA